MKVLVVNCGSSSLKAQLMETDSAEVFANAYCERVGINGSFMTYKRNGEKHVIEEHASSLGESVNAFVRRAIIETMERDNHNKLND